METPSESELNEVYRVMIELFVFKFMVEVFEKQMNKSVENRCHVILTKHNYKPFVHSLYQCLSVFPKTTSPIHAINHWFLVNLHSLESCRLTLLGLTCVAVEPVVSTFSELQQFVNGQCCRLKMKIGLPEEQVNFNGDYLRLGGVLDTIYDTLPILCLIDKFKSVKGDVIDRVVKYFGVQNLSSLNEAKFWHLFGTIEDLKKYMDETKPLVPERDTVTVKQVQEVLKSALLDLLTPDFKEKYENCCVSDLISTLRSLKVINRPVKDQPMRHVALQWTKDMSFYKQDLVKDCTPGNHLTVLLNNPQLCPICISLGAHHEHEPKDCLLRDKLDLSIDSSDLLKSMMKLEVGALDSGSYISVYTDGSYKQGHAGVGVFFADGDEYNMSCPARGRSALDAELLAIALALKIIVQKRPPRNYEIHTDSMAACNLVNGYTRPRNYVTEDIVNEAKYYLERATGKVRMNYVKGHSGVVENEMADFFAKEGRRRGELRARLRARNEPSTE